MERIRRLCKIDEMYKPPSTKLLRAARVALGLDQQGLAKLSGVSPRTVYRVEKGDAMLESVLEVQKALERKGIEFIDETDSKGSGLRLPKETSTSHER
jgi:predicted transcriptional regulator